LKLREKQLKQAEGTLSDKETQLAALQASNQLLKTQAEQLAIQCRHLKLAESMLAGKLLELKRQERMSLDQRTKVKLE
jgi:conjugal transfer/entry exclusion protein